MVVGQGSLRGAQGLGGTDWQTVKQNMPQQDSKISDFDTLTLGQHRHAAVLQLGCNFALACAM